MILMYARQPIFHEDGNLLGYELLYRDKEENQYLCEDGDLATSSVMAASFLSNNFDMIANKQKVFINFTRNMLLNGVATLFPADCIVVEILEDIVPDEDIIRACKKLKRDGYTIALDDFVLCTGEMKGIVELADIIKVDFMQLKTRSERKKLIEQLSGKNLTFLAEKVETKEDFLEGINMGYTLFQGYYFSKPIMEKRKKLPPTKLSHLKMLKVFQEEDPKFKDVVEMIKKDVSYSVDILRIANTTRYYRGAPVESIHEAAVRLGIDELKKWLYITVLRKSFEGKYEPQVYHSVQRGKMLELLCEEMNFKHNKTEYFTLGILSKIDILTETPMENVLNELSVSLKIKSILLNLEEKHDEDMFMSYNLLLAFEENDEEKLKSILKYSNLSISRLKQIYYDSVKWLNIINE